MAHVIVTGGSSGIGLAVARLYLKRGMNVSLIARSPEGLDAAKTALGIGALSSVIHAEAANVADAQAISAAIARCESVFGPCDILVTSAGIVEPGAFDTVDTACFERQIATNFLGSVHAARAVYNGMVTRRSGSIMLVSSGAALIGIYGYTGYCASKFAVKGFAEALRSEARLHGITLSVCFPPDTETPQLAGELSHRPAEAEAVMGTVRPWKSERVAEHIVRAIDRKRPEVFFSPTLYALARLGPLFRPVLNWWFDRAIAKAHVARQRT